MSREKIILNQNDRFAVFSLPGQDKHLLIQETNQYKTDFKKSFHKQGFLFHPFSISTKSPEIFITADRISENPDIVFHSNNKTDFKSTKKSTYLEMAKRFIQATNAQYKKLVLSRIEVIENPGKSTFQIFLDLKHKYPDAFVYLFNHPITGCWMGASPEIFLQQNKQMYRTISLAGTRKRNAQGKLFAPWTQKEMEEQKIVSDFIGKSLFELGIEYDFNGPVTQKAGNLFHLKSTFDFLIPETKMAMVISQLHPTPAVCGLPKLDAQVFIEKNENHSRDYYTGFLGPVNLLNRTSLFVNLRCIKLSKGQFVLYLGGGITASSNPESEWRETVDKSETMKAVLL